MKRYICIHCHFYQPARENPWLEAIEVQDSAYPYHDWNERIAAECYSPNAAARILDRPPADVRGAWRDVVAVMPAGRALVEECLAADLDVWLWSNTDPIHLEKMTAGLPAVHDDSVSFKIGAMKPDAEFYRRNLALLARAPTDDVLFVDDRADNVAAAVARGPEPHAVGGAGEVRKRAGCEDAKGREHRRAISRRANARRPVADVV